ncbi:MAG: hypothetical protein HC888_16975 [Candidatus Competibacteraceae bacterium]|nr:hypothetical protein [Candidatus Competibacteraceae bacterium]
MSSELSRRGFLASAAAVAGGTALTATPAQAYSPAPRFQEDISPWALSMNTSTIRPATLADKIRVTAEAGWDAIELWIDDLEQHEKDGGNLKDLAKEIQDKGLFVVNVIGLWACMPATMEEFEASLPDTRERMRRMSDVGSKYAAAIPPSDIANYDLAQATAMYKRLLDIGRTITTSCPRWSSWAFSRACTGWARPPALRWTPTTPRRGSFRTLTTSSGADLASRGSSTWTAT